MTSVKVQLYGALWEVHKVIINKPNLLEESDDVDVPCRLCGAPNCLDGLGDAVVRC